MKYPEYFWDISTDEANDVFDGVREAFHLMGYDFDDIDFSKLPMSFVLKCTHDSGSVVLVRDKNHWDKDAAKKLLERGLSRNYYWSGREWPYKNVKPRILAEEMVDMNPVDYKWICLKGEPEVLCMCMDRQKGDLTFNYYDMNFNLLPFEWVHPNIKGGGKAD